MGAAVIVVRIGEVLILLLLVVFFMMCAIDYSCAVVSVVVDVALYSCCFIVNVFVLVRATALLLRLRILFLLLLLLL